MISPRGRLLFWFGAVILPAGLVAVHSHVMAMASISVAGAFLLIVAVDALFAPGRLRGIRLEFPQVVRFTRDREGTIGVLIHNEQTMPGYLRLGLAFPEGIEAAEEEVLLSIPKDKERLSYAWPCTPRERGSFRFGRCYFERRSPLGFWAVRASAPTNMEVRVYPNLLTEKRNLSALFLNRGAYGLHMQRQIGQGREFEKLREYVHGDSYDSIHWKATAKRNRPITKVFQIEKTQEVYVAIDASRLSARRFPIAGGPGEDGRTDTVLERFLVAALVLGIAAERQGDHFGLITFSDRIHRFIRAGKGRAHHNACRDALYTLNPQEVTPDFDELCSFINMRMRKRALVVFLTSLDDPALAESFAHNMDLLNRKHLVLADMVRPREARPVFGGGEVDSVNDVYRNLGGHIVWHNLMELQKVLRRKGVGFSLLSSDKLATDLVSQYVQVKTRQLL